MSSPRLRAFVIALAGMVIGLAISRFFGGSLATVLVIVLALVSFLVLRMRQGR